MTERRSTPHGEGSLLTVLHAYDRSGNTRRPTRIKAGDYIEWKRNGVRGCYRASVLQVWQDAELRTRLKVMLLSHDGREIPSKPVRNILGRGVLAVYDCLNNRLDPEPQ